MEDHDAGPHAKSPGLIAQETARMTTTTEHDSHSSNNSVKERPSARSENNSHSAPNPTTASGPISRKKLPTTVPWFHFPQSQQQIDDAERKGHEAGGSGWFTKEQEASEWLNLFYDLAVVAVLSVFSAKHELSKASVLPNFVSYYVLIVWLWITQTHYDVHYQAEDSWHRLTKFIQVILFLYIGAASSQWAPGNIRDYTTDAGVASTVVSSHSISAESFVTVAVALLLSRLLLAIQYGVSAFIGRRQGRRVKHQIHTLIASIVSAILTVVAIVIPAKSYAGVVLKIVFLYSSLAVEMIIHLLHIWKVMRDGRSIDFDYLGRRWGAFTLVILGEGLTSLTKAFSSAIDGLSSTSRTVYGQVVLAILIVVLLYSMLFNRFRPDEAVSPQRYVWWEILHFLLHFGILLLLAAITNWIVVLSFADGVANAFEKFLSIIMGAVLGESPDRWSHSHLVGFIDRLGIQPGLVEEVADIAKTMSDETSQIDGRIVAVQYFGQIVYAAMLQYNVETSDETVRLLNNLTDFNATMVANETAQDVRYDDCVNLMAEILSNTVEEEYAGTLWLFPTAGGIMMLCGLRSLLWTSRTSSYNFKHVTSRLVNLVPLIIGLILALLGLLSIGGKTYDLRNDKFSNPYYWLLDDNLPLVVVFLAYFVCYFCAEFGLWWIARRKKRRQRAEAGAIEMREQRLD